MDNMEQVKELLEQIVEHRKSERGTVLERHAQTIMVGLVTVGIVWMSSSVSSTNSDIKVLKVQNEALQLQMTDLKDLVTISSGRMVSRLEFEAHDREMERRLRRLEEHVRIDEQGWRDP